MQSGTKVNIDVSIFDAQFICYFCFDVKATKIYRRYVDSEIAMKNHYYLTNMQC